MTILMNKILQPGLVYIEDIPRGEMAEGIEVVEVGATCRHK